MRPTAEIADELVRKHCRHWEGNHAGAIKEALDHERAEVDRLRWAAKQNSDDHKQVFDQMTDEIDRLKSLLEKRTAALVRINLGRHGELSAVEMAVIAYAALTDSKEGT